MLSYSSTYCNSRSSQLFTRLGIPDDMMLGTVQKMVETDFSAEIDLHELKESRHSKIGSNRPKKIPERLVSGIKTRSRCWSMQSGRGKILPQYVGLSIADSENRVLKSFMVENHCY